MKDHRVAVNVHGAASQFKGLSFLERIRRAKGYGVQGVEIHPLRQWDAFFDLGGAELQQFREATSTLASLSVHGPMGDTVATDDLAVRAEHLSKDKVCIRIASFLGAEVVVHHCRMAQFGEDAKLEEVAQIFRDLGRYGEAFGVKVSVETSTSLTDPAHFLQFIDRVDHPNLGATLDTGHLLRCIDEDLRAQKKVATVYNHLMLQLAEDLLARGKLFHIHINDIYEATLYDHYGPGLGFMDFAGLIERLEAYGYAGMMAIEMNRGRAHEASSITDDEFQEAIVHLQSLAMRGSSSSNGNSS